MYIYNNHNEYRKYFHIDIFFRGHHYCYFDIPYMTKLNILILMARCLIPHFTLECLWSIVLWQRRLTICKQLKDEEGGLYGYDIARSR